MEEPPFYPDWDKPATKGDLIKVTLACSKILRNIIALEFRLEDSKVSRKMIADKIFLEINDLTSLMDELGGSKLVEYYRKDAGDDGKDG